MRKGKELFCDGCGSHTPHGGIEIRIRGERTRLLHLKSAADSLYCSEICIQQTLLGIALGDGSSEELARQVTDMSRRLRNATQERWRDIELERADTERYRQALMRIRGTITCIEDERLTEQLEGATGARLVQLLKNIRGAANS